MVTPIIILSLVDWKSYS